jgi:flagellin-specific chaperone FliS
MSLMRVPTPLKLLQETEKLRLMLYTGDEVIEENKMEEEVFYLSKVEIIQQKIMQDLNLNPTQQITRLERIDANIDAIHRALFNVNVQKNEDRLTVNKVIYRTIDLRQQLRKGSCVIL